MQDHYPEASFSKAPVFICGEGRSGTKLLRDCLAQHPNLHNFRCESYFFVDSIFQKLRFIDSIKDTETLTKAVIASLISKNKSSAERRIKSQNFDKEHEEAWLYIKNIIKGKQLNRFELFDICASYLTKKANKARWIEKTPFHIYYIDKIQSFYPDAKFIINYRDPRAVVASWLKKDSNKTVLGVINTWNKVASRIDEIKRKQNPNIYFMKYENLIINPEKTIREICNFLDEDFYPELLNVSVVNSFYDEQGKSGFNLDAINRWQKMLSPSQILIVDKLSSKNRELLGYPDYKQKQSLIIYFIRLIWELLLLPTKKIIKFFKWIRIN